MYQSLCAGCAKYLLPWSILLPSGLFSYTYMGLFAQVQVSFPMLCTVPSESTHFASFRTMQHAATHCLQHTETVPSESTHPTSSRTLQHAATHWLQHTGCNAHETYLLNQPILLHPAHCACDNVCDGVCVFACVHMLDLCDVNSSR